MKRAGHNFGGRSLLSAMALVFILSAMAAWAGPQFENDCARLAAGPHRLAGTAEGQAAAEYVAGRLREIGVDEVIVQEFPVAQTRVIRCEAVAADGRKIALSPMRPNGIIPPVTPPQGITGTLLHAGKGSDADLRGLDPRGRIVVLDFNSRAEWQRVLRLGAKAVIFVRGAEPCEAGHFHYARTQANLPRFFHDGPRTDLPDGMEVTLFSEVVWERRTGRNVIGLLKGTDAVFDLKKEEAIVVSAPLDSYGEAPEFSPGARAAANCAGLLQLAADLKAQRPRRHVVLAFFDNSARCFAGASAFYWAMERDETKAGIAARMETWEKETAFLKEMLALADSPEPLAGATTDAGRDLLLRMRNEAKDRAYALRARLMDARSGKSAATRDSEEYRQWEAQEQQLKPEQDRWNELRRALGEGRRDPATDDLFQQVLKMVRAGILQRQTELATDENALKQAKAIDQLLGDYWITLHLSLMLGDATERWGVIIGGDSEIRSAEDLPGLYGRVQTSFLRAYETLKKVGAAPARFEMASVDGSLRQTRLLWAAPFLIHDGEMAGRYGIYNIVLGTILESLPREGTPDDSLARLDAARVERNIAEIALMLAAVGSQDSKLAATDAVADQEGLSLRRSIPSRVSYIVPGFSGGRPTGALVMGRQRGSSIPNTPVPAAVAMISVVAPWNRCFWTHTKPYAFDPYFITMTDQNGAYTVASLPANDPQPIGFAAAFDARGEVTMSSDMRSRSTVARRINTFPCKTGLAMLPPSLWPDASKVLDGRSNADISSDQSEKSFCQTTDGVVSWFCDPNLKRIKIFGLKSLVALAPEGEGITPKDNYGPGFPIDQDWLSIRPTFESASDLWQLNETRLGVLRSRDIMNSALEEQHGRVRDLLDEAAREPEVVRAEALAGSAFASAAPVYTQVRTGMDDLVKAALVLLALCVPFAFALERLLIGATVIYKQVSWFAGFFLLTFMVLYFSHPAFAIANTPVIIFLGFAIVLLSALVIFIIMGKFEVELKALQGMTSSVHMADISRFNTIMAAMSMGISTMRRRPLRTALTAVTIVLLTFTILGFASFDTQRGIVRIFLAPSPTHTGALLHQPNWTSFNPDFVEMLRSRWDGSQVGFCVRYWVCPEFPTDPDFIVTREDATRPVTLKGILGIPPEELQYRPDFRELTGLEKPEDLEGKILMTEAVAELLKVQPGARVNLRGRMFTVGPLLSAAALSAARDMDGGSILPVDFAAMKAAQAGQEQSSTEDMLESQGTWSSLPVDSIVIVPALESRALGGKPHIMTFYTEDAEIAAGVAEELARILDKTPVVATRRDGSYRHVMGTVVAASGVGDLFFPILLGGLVIFGTMLGSVADREKEIYTFSALGLAPPHVASLFFAEALVYSVLGGLGGYLLAQGSMKLLSLAAAQGWVQMPEMNYSSTNAIVTILIVMATVLISAIYPAIKASRSANPGLLRSWRLPVPKGDLLDLVFPFTVSAYDLTGVVSFLKEHFDQFSDTGLGCFMARDSRLVSNADNSLALSARLALAPFDLGVTQTIELRSAPSEIAGIDEVNVRIERQSGEPRDWARLNRILLDDLRRQFLLWRSLPRETMEEYRRRTLARLAERKGGAPA